MERPEHTHRRSDNIIQNRPIQQIIIFFFFRDENKTVTFHHNTEEFHLNTFREMFVYLKVVTERTTAGYYRLLAMRY
jgi:hypothetical protein